MKKRKLLYIGVAVVTFLAGVCISSYALLPSRSFTLLGLDGAAGTSGFGVSGRGIAYSSSAGDEVRYITSPQLEAALDYERSWSKYFSVVPHQRSR